MVVGHNAIRTIPDIAPLLIPLEDANLCTSFLLSLVMLLAPHSKDLFALPCCLGGMGIVNPMDIADSQFDASVRVTVPLKS